LAAALAALAAFTRLVGLLFIPVIDPNISSAYRGIPPAHLMCLSRCS
jgi:hypothetical protein